MARGTRRRNTRAMRARRARTRRRIIGTVALCLVLFLAFQTAMAFGRSRDAEITLKAESVSILQEEGIPEFSVKAEVPEKKQKIVLDKKAKYTVKDLQEELNSGQGYTLVCDSDGVTEGEYPVKIELSEELKSKITGQWEDRVTIKIKDGTFTVKNKVGEWDGDKFKRHDGTYVTEEYVDSKGATYYFDADGNKLTGEHKIGVDKCVFDEDGKLVSKESGIDPEKPMMALTFDDGPGDRTEELLNVLEANNARATFFMLGSSIPGHESAVQKMKDIGCEIASHSYDHPQLTQMDAGGIQKQMGDTDALLEQACGQKATVMRPPYGAINDNVKANMPYPMILWNIDTLDWKTKNAQATIDNVLQTADDGDIVLMHDIHSTSVDAAIQLIPMLIEKGYQLVTVSEMAEARGIQMEPGQVITDFNL